MEPEKKIKAVLFPRISSKEQEETGYSLSSQQELLENCSERHQFEIDKVFRVSETASGKKNTRDIYRNDEISRQEKYQRFGL
ncbi:MAG: hypothetical protein NT098_05335 [Candidatus Parcubacteria bacterium]|nr:hypothetical protein [Candidatus Parcubacteria bacterium]